MMQVPDPYWKRNPGYGYDEEDNDFDDITAEYDPEYECEEE